METEREREREILLCYCQALANVAIEEGPEILVWGGEHGALDRDW